MGQLEIEARRHLTWDAANSMVHPTQGWITHGVRGDLGNVEVTGREAGLSPSPYSQQPQMGL